MWKENTISCSYEPVTCNSDLFIYCQSSRKHSLEVRLANGSVPGEGILQIGIVGNWRNSCGEFSHGFYPSFFCLQLGYGNGRGFPKFFRNPHFRSVVPLCSFTDWLLAECEFFLWPCKEILEIKCFYGDWKVRLVNAVENKMIRGGNVEVFYRGKWITICEGEDNKWDLAEANIVCSQLGFAKAASAYSQSLPMSHNQHHSFLTVACNGSEYWLEDCEHMSPQNHLCRNVVAVCKKKECELCSF